MSRLEARPGAVLMLALLILLVLDCIVLGTLHLALLERRVADNTGAALRLRLAAEGAARVAIASWHAGIDSLTRGAAPMTLLTIESPERYPVVVTGERLAEDVFAVRADAVRPGLSPARAAALLLIAPPAVPPGTPVAAAALSAGGAVRIGPAGAIRDGADGGAALHEPAPGLAAFIERLLTLAPPHALLRTAREAMILDADYAGILICTGDLLVRAGTTVRGLIIVGGTFRLEGGAVIDGAVHVLGDAWIGGAVRLDAAAVAELVTATRLDRPRPHPGRAWLPAF